MFSWSKSSPQTTIAILLSVLSIGIRKHDPNLLLVCLLHVNRTFAEFLYRYPPDNGTGIWRDIELKKFGQVSLSKLRVTTSTELNGSIGVHLDITNMDSNKSATGFVDCAVHDPRGQESNTLHSTFSLNGAETSKLDLSVKIKEPQIWWPKPMG